jgi:hypothetical protein
MGRWAGNEFGERQNGQIHVLDLTYSLPNTQIPAGRLWMACIPSARRLTLVLSINAQSSTRTAYQLDATP